MVTVFSEADSKLLTQIIRVHSFLKHEEFVLHDIRTFDIDMNTADLLSRFLQKKRDIPDAILRMEEMAVERKYFSEFLSKYVAEEFSLQEDYSFTVIALLHYWNCKQISLDDAITELIALSSTKTICIQCCSEGETLESKTKIVNHHNYQILKGLDPEVSSDDDLSSGDDSILDPPYKVEEWESHNESDEDVGEEDQGLRIFNPFDSSEEEGDTTEVTSLNSSVSFNPFDGDGDGDGDSVSETEKSSGKKSIVCVHCEKEFSNRHNMKLHLIGLVISY